MSVDQAYGRPIHLVLTKDELIALAWKGTAVDDNTLASIVMQLRRGGAIKRPSRG